MVTSEQTQHKIGMRIHINSVYISLAAIKIKGIESFIDPVHTPLILMSYPSHGAWQTGESRDTPVATVVVTNRLHNHRIATDVTVDPANSGIIARRIIVTIGWLTRL